MFIFLVVVVVMVLVISAKAGRARRQGQVLCRACGASHPAFARFCRRCGKEL
jgi:ribosomal protein L40E